MREMSMNQIKEEGFMERITENVYALTTIRGCNPGYVVTSAGIVVIDTPQLPTVAVAMREGILKKGAIRFLINTENHVDHISGNHYFAGKCPVIGHEDILNGFWSSVFGDPYDSMVNIVKRADPQGVALIPQKKDYIVNRPNVTFSGRMTLSVGDHTFRLYHTPGHTKGQIAVYVPEEKVLFIGDTIFSGCQTWLVTADPESWLHSLAFLKTLDADYIVPGHGPICKKDTIDKQSAFIREWVTAVAVAMAKGWTLEECVARISFLDRFPMDIGQEDSGPAVQKMNVERIFKFLLGKTERFSHL
jgi:cyclase